MERDVVNALVMECLEQSIDELDLTEKPILTAETKIFGGGGLLSSLALVSFLVDVEDLLSERHGMDVSLSDEQALSQSRTPFRSVALFVDFVMNRLDASKG